MHKAIQPLHKHTSTSVGWYNSRGQVNVALDFIMARLNRLGAGGALPWTETNIVTFKAAVSVTGYCWNMTVEKKNGYPGRFILRRSTGHTAVLTTLKCVCKRNCYYVTKNINLYFIYYGYNFLLLPSFDLCWRALTKVLFVLAQRWLKCYLWWVYICNNTSILLTFKIRVNTDTLTLSSKSQNNWLTWPNGEVFKLQLQY